MVLGVLPVVALEGVPVLAAVLVVADLAALQQASLAGLGAFLLVASFPAALLRVTSFPVALLRVASFPVALLRAASFPAAFLQAAYL